MAVYKIGNNKLTQLTSFKPDPEEDVKEKDIQKLTEQNLETLFNLKFVSGSLNQEFSLPAQEQDFYIDTLAFDESQKSFVLIEYKKDKSFSVIDQGFAYMAAAINNKAELVMELNEKLNKQLAKKDIDWEQTRVIFISPEFTNYQKNAINFKGLPILLYEVRWYSDNFIDFKEIKPYRASQAITKFTKDKTIRSVSSQVKVYTEEDLVKPHWDLARDLLGEFEKELSNIGIETKTKYLQKYIAYVSRRGKEWVNYVEIVPQQQGLKVYYRFSYDSVKSSLEVIDCSKIGHYTNGDSFVLVRDTGEINEAVRLAKESHKFITKRVK